MGAWDTSPWDNDTAADWFADLFDATRLREGVRATLESNTDENHEEIRAAVWILIELGRTYIWPVDHIDEDIELGIKKMEEIVQLGIYADTPDFVKEIEFEIAVLRARRDNLKTIDSPELKEWWQNHLVD